MEDFFRGNISDTLAVLDTVPLSRRQAFGSVIQDTEAAFDLDVSFASPGSGK